MNLEGREKLFGNEREGSKAFGNIRKQERGRIKGRKSKQ